MIHTLLISADSEPASALKLFRKQLMTGGSVVRVEPTLSAAQTHEILNRFSPAAEQHSMREQVLLGLVDHPSLALDDLSVLCSHLLPAVRDRARAALIRREEQNA